MNNRSVIPMHGKIINYDSETEIGLVSGENGKNYTLSIVDCRSMIPPKAGLNVNFEPHIDKATNIYVISAEVPHNAPVESTHHAAKKPRSNLPRLVAIGSLVIVIALLIYAELNRKKTREGHDFYASQIKQIETLLINGNCTEAKDEYLRAKETRNTIEKRGFYFSMHNHAQQAHAIEIAECYAHKNEYNEAISMLDINDTHTPDYFTRASVIYNDAGDTEMAEKAKSLADEFDTTR